MINLILGVTAGLALFLYGVTRLSQSLRRISGDRLKGILEKCTNNVFLAIVSGTIVTILLDSSSVTIIMIIALVNAGVVSFHRALGVIMGANIGTTLSSQIFAFQIDQYAGILLIVGFLVYFISKRSIRYVGLVLFGFGLIFFGLGLIGEAVEPLKNDERIVSWLTSLENPIKGVLVGGFLTLIIQSSSATMGIVITLASQGMISLPAGVAIMIGAEIGTCADTLLASMGRSRSAIRAGLFHLFFNLSSVIIGLLLYQQLAALATFITPGEAHARQIANAHVIFNLSGVLLFCWFTRPIARWMEKMLPDRSNYDDKNEQSSLAITEPSNK